MSHVLPRNAETAYNITMVKLGVVAAICFLSTMIVFASGNIGNRNLIEDAIKRRQDRREAREHALLHKNMNKISAKPQSSPSVVKSTNPQDQKALEDFYLSTNGQQWTNNSGWMKGDPCQNGWYGIYCSSDGRVLELTLVYNLLSGSIPTSITDLTQLQVLMLYSNNIQGTIPAGLFALSSLQTLDLDNNQIGGTLPSSISNGNLTVLNLYSNKIHGTIPTSWDAPKLYTLSLSSNMLTGPLPPALGKLAKLNSLVLSRNLLSGTFPEEYGNLTTLQVFWLFDNKFDRPTIPNSWSRLTRLVNVEFDGLAGEFPTWIGSWSDIWNLVIVDGFLTGSFPTSLCSLKKVQYLHIFNNSLSGQLPNCMCELPQSLNSLELSDNDFSGSIPDCVGKLRNLTDFYLSRNNLSGNLPKTLGDIHYLNVVDFSSNLIVGSVPSSYAGLNGGTFGFTLCYNKLSSFESGLQEFFKFIEGYTCALYENPWNCPLPDYIPKGCEATCSNCNTGSKQTSCSSCTADSSCGWCSQGPNCLEGSRDGPDTVYRCGKANWYYGSSCPRSNNLLI